MASILGIIFLHVCLVLVLQGGEMMVSGAAKPGYRGVDRLISQEPVPRSHNMIIDEIYIRAGDKLELRGVSYDGKGVSPYWCTGTGPHPTDSKCKNPKNHMKQKGVEPAGRVKYHTPFQDVKKIELEMVTEGEKLEDRDWLAVYCPETHQTFAIAYLNLKEGAKAHQEGLFMANPSKVEKPEGH